MNQEQAKAWLPLIQAVAEGKTLQRPIIEADGMTFKKVWHDCEIQDEIMSIDPKHLRIKPEPKKQWYRVALLKSSCGHVWTDTFEGGTEQIEKEPQFVRWLTYRIEYELPEGEA